MRRHQAAATGADPPGCLQTDSGLPTPSAALTCLQQHSRCLSTCLRAPPLVQDYRNLNFTLTIWNTHELILSCSRTTARPMLMLSELGHLWLEHACISLLRSHIMHSPLPGGPSRSVIVVGRKMPLTPCRMVNRRFFVCLSPTICRHDCAGTHFGQTHAAHSSAAMTRHAYVCIFSFSKAGMHSGP